MAAGYTYWASYGSSERGVGGGGGQGMAVQLGRACEVFGTAILLARGTCTVACVVAAVKVVAVCSVSGEARGSEETGTLEAVQLPIASPQVEVGAAPNGHRAERPAATSALCARLPGNGIAGQASSRTPS